MWVWRSLGFCGGMKTYRHVFTKSHSDITLKKSTIQYMLEFFMSLKQAVSLYVVKHFIMLVIISTDIVLEGTKRSCCFICCKACLKSFNKLVLIIPWYIIGLRLNRLLFFYVVKHFVKLVLIIPWYIFSAVPSASGIFATCSSSRVAVPRCWALWLSSFSPPSKWANGGAQRPSTMSAPRLPRWRPQPIGGEAVL